MLSELLVESFYAYIPESHDSSHPQAKPSQRLTYAIKDRLRLHKGERGWISSYTLAAERVAQDLPSGFALRSAASLVPIPGSLEPPPVPGPHHSVSREIAHALVAAGLGQGVDEILVRGTSVERASRGGRRSALIHRDSLRIADAAPPPREPVVLIDDVTTTGAQMIGAALRLVDSFPGLTEIYGFALIRTVTEAELKAIHDPVRRVAHLVSRESGACSFGDLEPD